MPLTGHNFSRYQKEGMLLFKSAHSANRLSRIAGGLDERLGRERTRA